MSVDRCCRIHRREFDAYQFDLHDYAHGDFHWTLIWIPGGVQKWNATLASERMAYYLSYNDAHSSAAVTILNFCRSMPGTYRARLTLRLGFVGLWWRIPLTVYSRPFWPIYVESILAKLRRRGERVIATRWQSTSLAVIETLVFMVFGSPSLKSSNWGGCPTVSVILVTLYDIRRVKSEEVETNWSLKLSV